MRTILTTIVLALLIPAIASGGEIQLKKSWWSGPKYSTDGTNWIKVSKSGHNLRAALEGNPEAQAHMDAYKKNATWSIVLGYPGGALIGWPIGGYIGGGEWEDYFTPMIITGSVMAIGSMVLAGSANKNIENAVAAYTQGVEESVAGHLDVGVDIAQVGGNRTVLLKLGYSF